MSQHLQECVVGVEHFRSSVEMSLPLIVASFAMLFDAGRVGESGDKPMIITHKEISAFSKTSYPCLFGLIISS